ncbi:MAG: glycosyltransferase [Verrucomicrobiales bacterium]|nr:glycosyltransferase [Verrucomicrobiales bacterium]
MRIAFLTHEPFYPPSGGGSAEAVYLVETFVRRGHHVELFGPQLPDAAEVEKRFGIRLHPFASWEMGRYTSLRTPKYLAYPIALERLVRGVAASRPYDLLFSQHAISAVAAGRLRRSLRLPVVMNFLDCLTGFLETWPPWLMPRPVARALVRYELAIPRKHDAEGVLTVSDALRDRFVHAGVPADRVHSIYYGYDADRFRRPTDVVRRDTDDPVVVMHGSFDRHHLGPIARDAVVSIARRRPRTRFRFVGRETPTLATFLKAVRSAEPGIRIEAVGFVPYAEIPGQLATATVGITPYEPSTGTHCAFVAKTVEYLALGLPVVSTPLESGLRYYAGLRAVSFSEPDGAGFADAVVRWLDTPAAERDAAVAPASAKVAAELDWRILCSRAVDIVERLHAAHASRRTPDSR